MKTSVSLRAPRLVALLALAFASLSVSSLSAQTTVKTVPVGVVNLTVPAGSVGSPSYTALSLPLTDNIVHTGKIVSVGSATPGTSTITVSNTLTQTMNASNPYFIRFTSGNHAGRTFIILSRSGNTLTVDNEQTPLTTLTPALNVGASGDSFIISAADTLSSLFGSAVQGGTTPAAADQVWLWSSTASFAKYFYNTSTSQWEDSDFGDPANNIIIRPDAGFFFVRRATTPLTIQLVGQIPTTDVRAQVSVSGFTFISGAIPIPTTLNGLSIQTSPSWVKTTSADTSDQIWVWSSATASFARYYFDSSAGWTDTEFGDPSGTNPIPVGTPVFVRKAAVSGSTTVTTIFPLPANYATNNL